MGRPLILHSSAHFEMDELALVKKMILQLQEYFGSVKCTVDDLDQKLLLQKYLQFLVELFGLLLFLNENIGFRKLRNLLEAENQQMLDQLTFNLIFEDPKLMRPVIKAFLRTRSFMDKSQIIRNNFKLFFSQQE